MLCAVPESTARPLVTVHERVGRYCNVYRIMYRKSMAMIRAPERLFGIAAARASGLRWARVSCTGTHWLGYLRCVIALERLLLLWAQSGLVWASVDSELRKLVA